MSLRLPVVRRVLVIAVAAGLTLGAGACDQAKETVDAAREGGFCGVWDQQKPTILDAVGDAGSGALKAAGTALDLARRVAPEDVREPLRIIAEELTTAGESGEGVDPRVVNAAADKVDEYCEDR